MFDRRPALRLVAVASVLACTALGCDLLSEATTFSVDTDWQTITVDSEALGISIPSGTTIPEVPCTANDICSQASAQISCSGDTYSCSLQCGAKGTCEITVAVEEGVMVDLSEKIKNETSAEALQKVELQRVIFNTEENKLNFDTPKIELFVGPQGATKTTDSGVVKFATMPSIPAGTIVNDELKDVTDQGRSALANFVRNYQTPFRFLIKSSLTFPSGEALPQGRLVLKLKAYFQVEPL